MKRFAMFAITVTVGSSTIVNIPGDNYFAIIPKTCQEDVALSTQTVCPPPTVSTGPFTLRVSTDPASDCYTYSGIFPNGDPINKQWVKCP